jgi:phage baseplate assembly protein W
MAIKSTTVWSDIDPRFVGDALGGIRLSVNIDAVMSSIDNIVRTSPGERLMNRNFGLGLRNVLFENMNSTLLNLVSRRLKEVIEAEDDRVLVTEISFFQEPDLNTVSLGIKFVIKGQNNIYKYVTSVKGELV